MEKIKSLRINPILNKELIVNSRSIKISIQLALYNLILMLIALPIFQGIVSSDIGRIDYVSVMQIYPILAAVQCAVICLAIPIFTASSIAGERERQTLDVLLTTPVSTMSIIRGKLLSAMFSVLLYVICSLPIMSVAFIFGGMSWLSIIKFIILVLVASALAGSIGIFCSSITKKTISSIILAFVIIGVLIFGSITLFSLIIGIIEYTTSYLNSSKYKFFFAPFLLLGNPAVLIANQVITDFTGIGIKDVGKEIKSNLMPYVYFVTQFWTLFSIIVHLLLTKGFMKLAARAINPVKGKSKKNVLSDSRGNANAKNINQTNKMAANAVNNNPNDNNMPDSFVNSSADTVTDNADSMGNDN
ncbi:MAG: ABC transporter permease [Lachnospiraceae bacterium]|nr:ABC transporter permease [Lachnospiraceae bacterium]